MQETALKKRYTYKDYLRTPEDRRYELIEGELLMIPAPIPRHQRISRRLEYVLERFVSENDLGEVFDAPIDVYLDNENVVQPDILFISKDRLRIIGEKNIEGPPCLVIEILSEETAHRDLIQKKRLYERFGVKEYWIVDPVKERVELYTLSGTTYTLCKTYTKEEELASLLLEGLKIDLKEVF